MALVWPDGRPRRRLQLSELVPARTFNFPRMESSYATASFFSQGSERFLRLCEEMEGEDLSVISFLESIQGIRAKCCAVDENLLNALSLLKASQTPGSDQEGHTSTPSTRISLSSSGPQRRRDEDVSLPTCSFSPPLSLKVLPPLTVTVAST